MMFHMRDTLILRFMIRTPLMLFLKLFEFRYKLDKKCFLSKIHFTVKCHEKFSSTSCSTRIVPIN